MFGRKEQVVSIAGGARPPVLAVSDLAIRFGGLQALQGLEIEVNEFEIVGLIGPNGAGKTTAFNCITGLYQPDEGSVRFKGVEVSNTPPHVRASLGIGRTFQNVGMVKSATALDNLRAAQHVRAAYSVGAGLVGGRSFYRSERELRTRAESILELLGLGDIRDELVGGQPYGTLKLLELGCAIATDPELLLLDEPTSGMGPEESEQLGDRLLELRRELQLTMLVIEHHVPLVLRVCDHVYVLNFGRLLAAGEPSVIQTHPEVVAAYLGGEAPEALAQTEESAADAALDAETATNLAAITASPHAEEAAELPEAPAAVAPSRARKKPRKSAPARTAAAAAAEEEREAVAAEEERGAVAEAEKETGDEGVAEDAGAALSPRERRAQMRPSEVGATSRRAKSAEAFTGEERRGVALEEGPEGETSEGETSEGESDAPPPRRVGRRSR